MLMEATLEQWELLEAATILLAISHVHAKKTTELIKIHQSMGKGELLLLQDFKRQKLC